MKYSGCNRTLSTTTPLYRLPPQSSPTLFKIESSTKLKLHYTCLTIESNSCHSS
ncbi:hypothetical protein Mapa_007851 [Marchantia paleacea]|nr:hypothetical protein Mapa_007851 [Marchantia paleacea]